MGDLPEKKISIVAGIKNLIMVCLIIFAIAIHYFPEYLEALLSQLDNLLLGIEVDGHQIESIWLVMAFASGILSIIYMLPQSFLSKDEKFVAMILGEIGARILYSTLWFSVMAVCFAISIGKLDLFKVFSVH